MELTCIDAQLQLEAHAGRSLESGPAAALGRHLRHCRSCRQEFELECRLRRLPESAPGPPQAPALWCQAIDACEARTAADRLRRTGDDLRSDLDGALSVAVTDPWLHLYCPLAQAFRGTRGVLQLAAATLVGQVRQALAQLQQGLVEGWAAWVALGLSWQDLPRAPSTTATRP